MFNSESNDLGGFKEVIEPTALDGVVAISDVLCLLNHNEDRGILARSKYGEGSLELTIDEVGLKYRFEAPATALGDEWKKYIAGLKEWNASCEGDYAIHTDTTGQKALQDAYLNGTEVTIELYVDSENFYSGTAYISSLSIEDPVDDVVSFSCEFTGTGQLTFEV